LEVPYLKEYVYGELSKIRNFKKENKGKKGK
jgi:hypothetical protein